MSKYHTVTGIPLVSFFSGGGFLDLGFEHAGFNVVWSNEINSSFVTMYRAGMASWRRAVGRADGEHDPFVNEGSIEELTGEAIISEAFGPVASDFFGVIGGPPCQDFSQAGRDLGFKGERGRLTQVFANKICSLQPSFFLMENVSGLYRKKHRDNYLRIVRQLEEGTPGYYTSSRILDALEHGVPQHRERLFLVGFRKDIIEGNYDSPVLPGQKNDWFVWPERRYKNARKLAWPTTDPFGCEACPIPPSIPLELTVGRLLAGEVESLPNGQEAFRPYSRKFYKIREGDVSGKSFKRLHRYRYSPTAWYGNNEVHLHPWKPRRLTVREALRIQTVPDEYVLPPTGSLTDKFKMISNGVPPLLAQQIANALLDFITAKKLFCGKKQKT